MPVKVAYNFIGGWGFYLSEAAEVFLAARGVNLDVGVDRHDPRLIEAVETLGEAVNGSGCDIRIKEISGTVYRIVEVYGGSETVETPSTIGWIVVNT